MRNRLTVKQVSAQANCTDGTVRKYMRRGVIEGLRDPRGRLSFDEDAPKKVRGHMAAHGGPGGRSLLAPS